MFEDKVIILGGDHPEQGEWTLTLKGDLCKVQDASLTISHLAGIVLKELKRNPKPCGCKDEHRTDRKVGHGTV